MTDRPTLTLATRRSPLARTQTDLVAASLRAAGVTVNLLELVTTGDRWSAAGGTDATRGLFVKELEEALLDGRADLAVHSAKDLPGDLPDGLAVIAVPERVDPSDVLVGAPDGLAGLPSGARVGTGSPRRVAQLRIARPDLEFVEVRGNVGTRLEKRDRGEYDALVLAAAGLARLGLAPAHLTTIPVTQCVPAPGQGALAIEGRDGDPRVTAAAALLHDDATGQCVAIERTILAGLGGGCREPIGALARHVAGAITVDVFAATEDGGRHTRRTAQLAAGTPATDPTITALVNDVRRELGT